MKIRKTISLEEDDYTSLEPLLKKHDSNFSKAIRELIRNSAIGRGIKYLKKPISPQELWDRRMEVRHLLVEEGLYWLSPLAILMWFLQVTEGIVPPMGLYKTFLGRFFPEIIGKEVDIGTYYEYINFIRPLIGVSETKDRYTIEFDDPKQPKHVKIRFEISRPGSVESYAKIGSYIVAHAPLLLKPVSVTRSPTFIDTEFEVAKSEEEAYEGLVKHFGFNQDIYEGLQENPDYWRVVFKMAKLYDGSLVVLSQKDFIRLQKGEEDMNSIVIQMYEKLLGSPISDVSLDELLASMEIIGKANGFIKKIDIDSGKIKIYFAFHDPIFAQMVSSTTVEILRKAGYDFQIKKVYDDWCILTLSGFNI
jgi:hypothetical protein